TDAHVHFLCAGVAQHANDLATRRAAHDRIVDNHDALAFQDVALSVELDLHAEIANRLLRLDDAPANIVVADQSEFQWDLRLLGVTDGRRHTRVGYGCHQICLYTAFPRQLAAERFAHPIDVVPKELAVRTREIDIFENTLGMWRGQKRLARFHHTVRADRDNFSRLYVANVFGFDQIQRASLRRNDIGAAILSFGELSQHQRTKAVGIARRNHFVQGEE